MRIALLPVLALFACSGGGSDTTIGTGTPTDTGSGTFTGGPTGTPGDVGTAVLNGTAYLDGAPWEGANIRLCDDEKCRTADSGPGGAFTFPETLERWNSLEIPGPTGGAPYASAYVPLIFAENEVRDVSLFVVPLADNTPTTGTPAEYPAGNGLYITIATGDLKKPLLQPEADSIGGVHLTEDTWVPVDELPGTVVHQWFTAPWDYKATTGLPVRLNGPELGLDGTEYRMYVGSYKDFAWLEVGTFTDGDMDGWYTSTGTLPLLSTVILVDESAPTSTSTTGTSGSTSGSGTSATTP